MIPPTGRSTCPPLSPARSRSPIPPAERSVRLTSDTARVAKFDPVRGVLRVELRWTPLFAETITWRLTLPVGYEAGAFEGNVEVAAEPQAETLRSQKHLARSEAPTVQIFYTKTQLN